VARISDAVVIGSRLVQEIETSGPEQVIGNIKSLVGSIRRAMDE
jgi:tryptophan synthase alpha chain